MKSSDTILVLSISGVLNGLVRETVTSADLDQAYFFVAGHWRTDDAGQLRNEIRGSIYDSEARAAAVEVLRLTLSAAEQDGRVHWQDETELWSQLNGFLQGHDLPTITPVDLDIPGEGRYSYPAVQAAVRQQLLPFRLIWNG